MSVLFEMQKVAMERFKDVYTKVFSKHFKRSCVR